jgi:GTPase SAR1 family protein
MSSSNATGSSNPHPLLENNEEKHRSVDASTPYRPIAVSMYVDQNSSVVIKVGMVGDSQIGKTSLMVKYVEGSFDEVWMRFHTLVTPLAHHVLLAYSGLHSDSR